MMGGLMSDDAPVDYLRAKPRQRKLEPIVALPGDNGCRDCGSDARSRRARGDSVELPVVERR